MSEPIRTEDGKVKFELTISASDYIGALNGAYRRNAYKYQVPGFRKGKAPRRNIEAIYGKDTFWDTELETLVQRTCAEALQEHNLIAELSPDVVIESASEADGVVLTAEIVVRPEVKLGQYKGIEMPRIEYAVTDEEVEAEINRRLESAARTLTIEDRPLQEGDTAIIDFAGYLGDEQFEGGTATNHSLKIGSHTFIPGFEEQMVGMNVNEERDINVTFPEDYPEKKLAGQGVVFKVTVHNITMEELPELDDDFVQDTSEYENVDQYKVGVRNELEKSAAKQAKFQYENNVLQKAIDNAEVSIHNDIIEAEVEMQINRLASQLKQYYNVSMDDYMKNANIDIETLRSEYRTGAEANLKGQYVIGAIIDTEHLEPTEEDYLEAVRRSNSTAWDEEKVKSELEANRSKYISAAMFESVVSLVVGSSVELEPEHKCDCGCEEHDHEECDCADCAIEEK